MLILLDQIHFDLVGFLVLFCFFFLAVVVGQVLLLLFTAITLDDLGGVLKMEPGGDRTIAHLI